MLVFGAKAVTFEVHRNRPSSKRKGAWGKEHQVGRKESLDIPQAGDT